MFGRLCNLIALFISTLFSTEFYDSKDVNVRCFYCLQGGIKLLNRRPVPCSILLSLAKLLTDLATVECELFPLLPW